MHEPLYRAFYERLSNQAQVGLGKLWTGADDAAEFARFQKVQLNLSRFAAFRVHHLGEQLRAELHDLEGNKLSREDFLKKANGINKRYEDWFKTEAETASARANIVAKWGEFERRAYLYPNLRYVTAKDERVRDSHRLLHGIVKPINDPFWNRYTPPVGYRCRCIVQQVDDAVTADTEMPDLKEVQIPKGFDENPYYTGGIFTDRHPYIAKVTDPSVRERIEQNVHQIWLNGDAEFQFYKKYVVDNQLEVAHGITADEAASIRFYTADVEKRTYQYTTQTALSSSKDANFWSALVATLTKALDRIKTVFVGKVVRGASPQNTPIELIKELWLKGEVWRPDFFLSSSKTGLLDNFDDGVEIRIQSKRGGDITNLSWYEKENEVLFSKGTPFKIVSVQEETGKVLILLEETD